MDNHRKIPKEIDERIARQATESKVHDMSVAQALAMLEQAGKLFVKSKVGNQMPEMAAICWLVEAVCALQGDLMAYSVHKGYVKDLEELTIQTASQTHAIAVRILEEAQGKKGSDIIIPPEVGP